MKLHEIKDDESLVVHVVRKLLKNQVVHYWHREKYVNSDTVVEIVDIEDDDGWVRIHFGVPNERTGDIDDATGWRTEDFRPDQITVTKNDKGEWWLHEVD